MKREKFVLTPTLKAEDYEPDTVVIETGYIKDIQAVKTRFDDESTTSTVIVITDESEKDRSKADKGIFANTASINNLIDAYGEEDHLWKGKPVKVTCDKNNFYKKKAFVITAKTKGERVN